MLRFLSTPGFNLSMSAMSVEGKGTKRCPAVEALYLEENGVEMPSKLGSFEVESVPERKTESLADLFDWPRLQLEDLQSFWPEGYSRLCGLLFNQGLEINTFYSGQDCAGQALHFLLAVLAQREGKNVNEVLNSSLCVASASDVDPTCQRVLASFQRGRARHVFGDLCDRVAPKALQDLQAIAALVESEVQNAMAALEVEFKPAPQRNVVVHVLPQAHADHESAGLDLDIHVEEEQEQDAKLSKEDQARKTEKKKQILDELGCKLFDDMWAVLRGQEDADRPTHGRCCVHGQNCPFHGESAGPGKASLWIAGTTCADECPTGTKRGLTGKAALPYMVFMSEVTRHLPDMFLHECAHLFNVDNLHKAIGEHYNIFSSALSPHHFGVPYTRPRMISWCIRKQHDMIPSPLGNYSMGMPCAFHRSTDLHGDVFFSWMCGRVAI